MSIPKFYVGSMNDSIFIIDQPPRPSTDYCNHEVQAGPNVVADCGNDIDLANRLVFAWNNALEKS